MRRMAGSFGSTDGTAAGTTLIADINPGSGSSSAGRELTALGNGSAMFSANDGIHGNELWVTDGTAAGTALVADIDPGSVLLRVRVHRAGQRQGAVLAPMTERMARSCG